MLKKIIDKRNYIILIIITILFIGIIITNIKPKNYTKEFDYFNEKIIVNLYKVNNGEKIFDNIDKIYKKYDKFYQNKDKNNKDFLKLIKYGKDLYKESNGLIDITSKELQESIEDDKEINYETTINNINLKDKNTLININTDSIIGAYATNEVVKYLKKENINNFLINEDGNIITGNHYDNDNYKISIIDKDNNVIKILKIKNKAVAVKGNTTTFKPYMVNPITKSKNKTNDLIVVIDKDINKANVIANILYLMDRDKREEYIKENNIKALWQTNNTISTTKSFQNYTK